MRGAVIPTSAHQGVPTTFALRCGITVPRFLILIVLVVTGVRLHLYVKRTISGIIILVVAICAAYAQNDVTKFLGIPVDGSKSALIQKLKAKDFRTNSYNKDIMDGNFNGMDVNLHIVTNGDKVCRIMLCDAHPVDERSIQIRFNNLCRQFEKNPKYISLGNLLIPEDDDISYEISVKNKRYEAVFYQKPAVLSDTTLARKILMPVFLEKYTAEELVNPTEETQKALRKMFDDYILDVCLKKPVWFMISEIYGKYLITMYYDNEYNRANGEDL